MIKFVSEKVFNEVVSTLQDKSGVRYYLNTMDGLEDKIYIKNFTDILNIIETTGFRVRIGTDYINILDGDGE